MSVGKQYKRLGIDPMQQMFIAAFDGDPIGTAKRIAMMYDDGEMHPTEEEARNWVRSQWFVKGLQMRAEREALLTASLQRDLTRAAAADRQELQALWSQIARGEQTPVLDPDTKQPMLDKQGKPVFHPIPSMRDRLAASKMLADSLGLNIQTVVHEGGEKPIKVQKVELEERIKLISRVMAHEPTEAWLQ